MSGTNLVVLTGRLASDPEVKNINGTSIANFSIATSRAWKNESGEKQEKAQFTDCVAFKGSAEFVGKYFTKGKWISVTGELSTRSWDDKETGKKRYKTEVVANNIQFVGDSKKDDTGESAQKSPPLEFTSDNSTEDIPF